MHPRRQSIARVSRRTLLCLSIASLAFGQTPRDAVPLRARMLVAEDARPAPPSADGRQPARRSLEPGAESRIKRATKPTDPIEPLFEGLTSLPEIQAAAIRALGRLERPDLVPRMAWLLTATTAAVRAEAANAVAQAVFRGESAAVFELLRARIDRETDATVRGVLARSIGRLPYRTASEVEAAEAALLALLQPPRPASSTPPAQAVATMLGVAHGLESLARRTSTIRPLGDKARLALTDLVRVGLDRTGGEVFLGPGRDDGRRIRRLALGGLTAAGGVTEAIVRAAVADPDAQVRRLGVVAVARVTLQPWTLDVLEAALFDADPRVRIDALRQRGDAGGRVACQAAKVALSDVDAHVALAAIDLAGRVCQVDVAAVQAMDDLAVPPVADLATARLAWHRPAHALVSLARLMPDRTRARLGRFAAHPLSLVRLYAARAAGIVGSAAVLEQLARDADDNVADAALTELARLQGHRADGLLIAALGRADGQIVRNAARALAGTPRRVEATRALVVALARITVDLRETSRDVRIAILDRLEETGVGLPAAREELAAYVNDFDPAVAAKAAALVTRWRGTDVRAEPRPLPRLPLPTLERLTALRDTTAVITMVRGGAFRLRLFADDAPTNVARFARLSSSGFFNGLSFHRVEPTFVIQGGSPHANEYAGDGPFTRDEVGLRSHLRGTVGISTRGRDTGDGQIFVNLVDNVRLDHNYTIIGEVIDGLDVVDGILEGDTIREIRLMRGAAAR